MIDLIEIHCQEPRCIECEECGEIDENYSVIYYVPSECFGLRPKYLKCCVDKIGKVVDQDIDRTTRLK